jgi:hypothetical protein
VHPPRAGDGPKLIDQDGNEIDLNLLVYLVRKNPLGVIVAAWNEGRLWTPYESARLIQHNAREVP